MRDKIIKYSLFLIGLCAFVGILLGFTNSITAPIISSRGKELAAKALKEHYSYTEYSSDKIEEYPSAGEAIESIYYAFGEDGKLVSVIYGTAAKGYSGTVKAYVEIKADGTFGKTVMYAHGDTPSIAGKVLTHDFGITSSSVNSYEYQGASGATKTSEAVFAGIDAAAKHFKTIKDKVGGITND